MDGAAARIDAIEAELRRLGLWADEAPGPEAFEGRAAFLADTMAFTTWLQFVFIPRVRAVLGGDGSFPSQSMVGVQAVRELDGYPDSSTLVTLLSEFDRHIEGLAGMAGPLGTEALEAAAGRGDADGVSSALAAGAQGNATALTWAASAGSLAAVTDLLDSGVDPGIQDVYGVTPVFFASGYGHTGICAWLIDPGTALSGALWGKHEPKPGHVEVLRLLIDRGAAFDEPFSPLGEWETGGATPLMLAAALAHDAAVDELLQRGARRDATDKGGRTAADWAARRHHLELAARLRG